MRSLRKKNSLISFVASIFAFLVLLTGYGLNQASAEPLLDNAITKKIEDSLLFDRSNILSDVSAVTLNGIVTLTGKTQTLLQKERAADIARTVRGVRSVINEVAVEPPREGTDKKEKEDAEMALVYDYAVNSWEIKVGVKNHVATLTGTVDSPREKQLAETLVQGVEGIRDVENNLEISNKLEGTDDFQLQAEVRETLQWDVLVNDEGITVQVRDGEVTLKGQVGSAAEKKQAYSDAWVRGVSAVDDTGLTVDPSAHDGTEQQTTKRVVSDENIQNALKDAMSYDPRVSFFFLYTNVENGAVTLNGIVDNLNAKRAAEQDALNTAGVKSVANRINVQIADPTDQEIARRIQRILSWDPYINKYDIDVRVKNGRAYLTGTVDAYFEKTRADDLAATTFGITKVEDEIRVEEQKPQRIFNS